MKIGIVCYPSVGGSGILATELGRQLAFRGHEVHFITYEIPFRLQLEEKNIYFHEVQISHYDLFKYPDYALPLAVKMSCIAKQYQLDIFHVHYAFPHAISAFLAKQLLEEHQVAVVTTLHGTDITLVGKEPHYFHLIKFSIEKSDGVTAVSRALKTQTCSYFGITKPIEVIYNFFVPRKELMGTQPLRHLFVSEKQKLLVHSSNYRSVKRPKDLFYLFKKVREHIDCKLLLIGSGNGLEDIRLLAKEEKMEEVMIFLGNSREVDPYVASGDVFLLPSQQESFGLAALEAMAYGLPVVATRVGGIPELVIDGKTGYLASVGDIEKMADDVMDLLTDHVKYQQFSLASKERAAHEFSLEKIVGEYETYYKKILDSFKYPSNR